MDGRRMEKGMRNSRRVWMVTNGSKQERVIHQSLKLQVWLFITKTCEHILCLVGTLGFSHSHVNHSRHLQAKAWYLANPRAEALARLYKCENLRVSTLMKDKQFPPHVICKAMNLSVKLIWCLMLINNRNPNSIHYPPTKSLIFFLLVQKF